MTINNSHTFSSSHAGKLKKNGNSFDQSDCSCIPVKTTPPPPPKKRKKRKKKDNNMAIQQWEQFISCASVVDIA